MCCLCAILCVSTILEIVLPTSPCCSHDTHFLDMLSRRAIGEQRDDDDAEIFSGIVLTHGIVHKQHIYGWD